MKLYTPLINKALTIAYNAHIEGIPDEVIEALKLLTHKNGEPYMDYVKRISENPLARKVKLGDLAHNSNDSRNALLSVSEQERYKKKYGEAIDYLSGLNLYEFD